MSNITQATQDAADIVLVIDESGTMSMEHAWLLVMIPLLETRLIKNGTYSATKGSVPIIELSDSVRPV